MTREPTDTTAPSAECAPPAVGPDLADAVEDAAVALAGIAEALEWRTAAYPDDMLELLAEAASARAEALRAALPG